MGTLNTGSSVLSYLTLQIRMPAKNYKLACLQKVNIVLKDRITDAWVIVCTSGWFSKTKTLCIFKTLLYTSSYNTHYKCSGHSSYLWQEISLMTGIQIPFGKADCKQQAGKGNYPGNCARTSLSRTKELPAEGRRRSEQTKPRGKIALTGLWPRVKSVYAALSWAFLIFTAKPLIPHLERHVTANNMLKSQDVTAGWLFCQPVMNTRGYWLKIP